MRVSPLLRASGKALFALRSPQPWPTGPTGRFALASADHSRPSFELGSAHVSSLPAYSDPQLSLLSPQRVAVPSPSAFSWHPAAPSPAPRFARAAQQTAGSSASMSTQAGNDAEVYGLRKGSAAIAVLNRPKALNSLNDNMVALLKGLLEEWEKDPSVKVVIVKSDGRAYCAGGDVRKCNDLMKAGKGDEAAEFFRKEYELDYLMATYQKPCVPLINGVVMGGGNGISMHCPFRVVTEKVLFAMPETLIGLHPDVGASHFLARLPGHLGEFLALTGFRLKAADMLGCGLASHMVSSDRLPLLEERLCALRDPDLESVSMAIDEHADTANPLELQVLPRLEVIDKCFQHATVEEIMAALEEQAAAAAPAGGDDDSAAADLAAALDAQFCAEALAALKKMSPTSLKVSLRSVREGRQQTLAECLVKETRLSFRCTQQTTSHDFLEGVRALLVDKDNNPKWSPPSVAEVTPEIVDSFFMPFQKRELELQLPRKPERAVFPRSLL